jgi:hypothetical protein
MLKILATLHAINYFVKKKAGTTILLALTAHQTQTFIG